jgi:predicted nucleic acid-binding protein
VANALLVGERRGRITPADTAHCLAILGTFPIIVDHETVARAWVETMHLARAHKLSSYDVSYLELAMRLGLPLATLDDKLKAAAKAVGVVLFAAN